MVAFQKSCWLVALIAVVGLVPWMAGCRALSGEGREPQAELGTVHFMAWDQWVVGIRVHFVALVTNTGDEPVELADIRYEMRSPDGAVVETGTVPQSYPKRIAPGASAVIGRTVTADAATTVGDVASVSVSYTPKRAGWADNLLAVVSTEVRGENSFGQVEVVGIVRNDDRRSYDNVKIGVVMLDGAGAPIGYATANVPGHSVGAGDEVQFRTDADLPAEKFLEGIRGFTVFASDQ